MKVNFTDTFFDSVSRLARRERWYFKMWYFFRRDLPSFFQNVWYFRKALWNFRWWDWRYCMEIFKTSLEIMEKGMHNGIEEEISRNKKISKMQRAIYLMSCFVDDKFIEIAEKELGEVILHDWEFEEIPDKPGYSRMVDKESAEEKEHNSKVFARARQLEEEMWKELWSIIEGQDRNKFVEPPTGSSFNERDHIYHDQLDGSGMQGWWD